MRCIGNAKACKNFNIGSTLLTATAGLATIKTGEPFFAVASMVGVVASISSAAFAGLELDHAADQAIGILDESPKESSPDS
jgi:hypothetical protein